MIAKDPTPTRDERNATLREATGRVDDPRPLVGLLYDLMRDHLPVGDVDELVRTNMAIGDGHVAKFTDGHLARIAQLFAEQLGVRVGVQGQERDARFAALDRILRHAAAQARVELGDGFPGTLALVEIADTLDARARGWPSPPQHDGPPPGRCTDPGGGCERGCQSGRPYCAGGPDGRPPRPAGDARQALSDAIVAEYHAEDRRGE